MHLRHGRRLGAIMIPSALLLLAAPAGARLDYEIRPGDTLGAIALQHGVTSQALAQANGLDDPNRIVAGAVLVIPGAEPTTYVVQPGDTLGGIAARFGVTARALAEANGITDPDLIRAGQTLSVEGGAGDGGAAPASGSTSSGSTSSGSAGQGSNQRPSDEEVRALITRTAQAYGWRPAVPLGLSMQESGWNNTVVSSVGAMGLMQVLPATAEWAGTYLVGRTLDLRDPADNVEAGMAYLDYLYGRFDRDIELALAAYYEGPRRVEDNGGPSDGARRYVANVLALAERYG